MTNRIVDFPDGQETSTAPDVTDPAVDEHIADPTGAHAASAISNTPSGNLAATDVQGALNELQGDIDSLSSGAIEVAQDAIAAALAAGAQDGATLTYNDGANKFDLTNTDKGSTARAAHEADTSDVHAAGSISNTPSGNLAATDVQSALNELQTDVDTRATSSSLTSHTGASTAHGVSGVIVGTSDSQTLSNKTLSDALIFTAISTPSNPGSGKLKFYPKSDGKFYKLDENGSEKAVGSGGAGGINFLPLSTTWSFDNQDNVDAEGSAGNWTTFADAAASTPVDLTGGSPNITLARTTTSGEILNGSASLKITKTAANRQGEGVSCVFNVPPAYQGKFCKISIPYKVISGSLSSGDLMCFVYDVTNSLLITPYNNEFNSSSGTLNAFFVTTPSASTPANQQYRIGIYFATSGTVAQTIVFDDVSVGPFDVLANVASVASSQYTMTIGGTTSAPTKATTKVADIASYSINGDVMRITYTYAHTNNSGAAAGSGIYLFPLPAGYAVNTNLLTIGSSAGIAATRIGAGKLSSTTSETTSFATDLDVMAYNSTNLAIAIRDVSANNLKDDLYWVDSNTWQMTTAAIYISFTAHIPIVNTGVAASVIVNPNIGPWNELSSSAAASAWSGWTTVTSATARWRQNGDCIEYEAQATVQTGAASEARHSLPNSFVSAANYVLNTVGWGSTSVSGRQLSVLIEPSKTYFTFGDAAGVTTSKANTNALIDPGPGTISFFARVRVVGLSPAGVVNNPRRRTRFSGGNGYGSTNTKIRRFTTIIEDTFATDWYTVTNSATEGCYITITREGNFAAGYKDRGTAYTGLSLNSTQLTTNIQSITDADILDVFEHTGGGDGKAVWSGHLKVGDKVYYHTNAGSSATSNVDVRAWFACIGG